jgi:hypothetical protein
MKFLIAFYPVNNYIYIYIYRERERERERSRGGGVIPLYPQYCSNHNDLSSYEYNFQH